MSLLERVVRAHRCRSTHHYIALDALSLIGGEQGKAWKAIFLVHHEHLLEGAKAPDAKFKDFKNHVCHVNEGLWGGAPDKAMEWYARSIEFLRAKKWSKAAYALGVLSHYYADPIQPFHTGQTEEEGVIHRAVEWSIAKSRDVIDEMIEANGYPDIQIPDGPGFVADMVVEGATLSNTFYDTFIDHYNLERGVSHPPSGLDDTMREGIAELVAYATAGFAALMTQAIEEAAVAPPKAHLTLQGYIETLDIPLRWITAKLADANDRAQVERMYKEFKKTGKVIKTLPEDDKIIRKKHAAQVLRVPLKEIDKQEIRPIGTAHVLPEGEVQAIVEEPEAEIVEEDIILDEAAEVEADVEEVEAEVSEEELILDEEDLAAIEAAGLDIDGEAELSAGDDEDDDDEEDYESDEDEDEDEDEYEDDEEEDFDEEDEDDDFDEDEDDEEYDEDDESDEYDEEDDEEYESDEDDDESEDDDEAEEYDDSAEEESGDEVEEIAASEDDEVPADEPQVRGSGLTREDPVVDAPSIGPKTAARLEEVGIYTIGDLLDCDIEETAFMLDVHFIDSETLRDWQDQTKLMMEVPGLRVHDVQIMVGAGIRTSKELAEAPARTLFLLATEFLNSPEGERVRRGDDLFMEEEVEEWIERARDAA
ncbi:DUF4332 domain-containing protein [Hyphomonas sp.]|uniref:DUF4332 domain-containing protein n=1 Tax=Hyphomonas sp. TaxID=87 RepID=UPI00352795E1